MADRIIVSTEAMEELIAQIKKLSSGLDAVKSDIRAIRMDKSSGSDVKIELPSGVMGSINRALRSGGAESCLGELAKATQDIGAYTTRLSGYVNAAKELFEENEKNIIRSCDSLNSQESLFNGICRVLGFGTDTSKWTSEMHEKYQKLIKDAEVTVDNGLVLIATKGTTLLFGENGLIGSYEEESSFTKLKKTLKLFGENNWKEEKSEVGFESIGGKYKKTVLDPNDIDGLHKEGAYEITKDGLKEAEKPQKGTQVGILRVGGTKSKSVNALGAYGAYEGDKLSAQGSATLAEGEAHASGYAGFGAYLPNEKGELQLYYGATGEVGASFSVAQVDGSVEYEICDFVSIGGEGEISAGKVEGKAGISAGIVGGEFAAYGEASAEALAVEAKGSANLDVGGVKGTIGGSANIGIGAHAKGGYHDGKLVFDVGVSVGPGVSVYGELDVSGALDNIADGVGKAVNALSALGSECGWW